MPLELNPWESRGLEWTVPYPAPVDNFAVTPIVVSGPYEYGSNAGPMAILNPSGTPEATTEKDPVVP